MPNFRRSLYIKSAIIGSPAEDWAKSFWRAYSYRWRRKQPELTELNLEPIRLPLVLKRLLKKDSCGLDVGAHIGSFLNQLIHLSPAGKHIAIEPSPQRSLMLERKFPQAKILQIAISDHNGRRMFSEDLISPGFSKLGKLLRENVTNYEVETRTIDDLRLSKLDLVKIDIEGAELDALRGGTETIRRFRPSIIFECTPECTNRPELYDFIANVLNYDVFTFTDFLYNKGPTGDDEFRKCSIYPFRAFNFIAIAQ